MTVAVAEEAADVVRRLTGRPGPLMLHQPGGCCDAFVADVLRAGRIPDRRRGCSPR
jgi:uncharacterized protein (DUF779 family)